MEHTEEQKRIMDEYNNSSDQDVIDFISDIRSGKDKLNYVTVAFISEEASEEIFKLTGKKVAGNRVVLDKNAVRHIENRHGTNGKQDQSMKDINDIARMGYVIRNYDEIQYDGLTTTAHPDENGKPSPMISFSKRIDGTYYVIETVNEVKTKRNYVVTAFIKSSKE